MDYLKTRKNRIIILQFYIKNLGLEESVIKREEKYDTPFRRWKCKLNMSTPTSTR